MTAGGVLVEGGKAVTPEALLPDEVSALLAAVSAFVVQEVEASPLRPEQIPSKGYFVGLTSAAENAGLLDSSHEGYGLWCEVARGMPPQFTLPALGRLAAGSPALAWHLHSLALGRLAQQMTGLPLWQDAVFSLDGTAGIGRSGLGRLLAARPLHGRDREMLADTFGARARSALVAPQVTRLVAPGWRQDGMHLVQYDLARTDGERDPWPHGLEGCESVVWQPAGADGVSALLLPGQLATLVVAQQLAQVALARGAIVPAAQKAHDYAALRVQGGHTIEQHDSVALLLADLDTALATVDALLRDAAMAELDVAQAVALRREAMPLLSRAINAVMQVHGGIGYMRDTGVEHVLRAVNCWRLLGASPKELGLVAAGLASDHAGLPEAEAGERDHLPGYLAASHSLSPFAALRRTPFLKAISSYSPGDPWELDTRHLPAALGRMRRRVRAFAEQECRPLAARIDREQREAHGDLPEVRELLGRAGKAGLLTDLLPAPLGSVPLLQYRHSLAWQQAIRVEELARVDGGLMLLLSAPALGLAPVILSGDLNIMRRVVLPAFRATQAGDPQLFAFAITEPAAGSDAEEGHGALHQRAGVRAHRGSGGWRLSGRKIFISGGDIARYVAVFAALEGEGYQSWTCFLVDARSPGFRVARTEMKMGMRASGAAELEFDECFVPDNMVVGGLRNGWGLARATLNLSRLPVAAMAVGFAQQAVDIATEYACRETLAGRPLLHYQHVQSTLADLQAETGAIRALVWRHAQGWTPRQDGAALCKFQATDRAQVVIEAAMDLLGSSAVRHDSGIERTFRDNRLTRIFEGTNQINRLAVIEDQQASLLARIARSVSLTVSGAGR